MTTFEQNGLFSQGLHREEKRSGNWFEPVAASGWGEKRSAEPVVIVAPVEKNSTKSQLFTN
jgi:hypothetical protein